MYIDIQHDLARQVSNDIRGHAELFRAKVSFRDDREIRGRKDSEDKQL